MTEGGSDHDLLLQSNERLIALNQRVEEFIATIRENSAETKRQHQEEINRLTYDVEKVKANLQQARGALWILYIILTLAGLYVSYLN